MPKKKAGKKRVKDVGAVFGEFVDTVLFNQDEEYHIAKTLDIIKQNPLVLETRFRRTGGCRTDGLTPLRYACHKVESSELISEVLDLCPKAASIPDENGRLPIHYLCRNTFSLDLVQRLVSHYPESVKAKTKDNETPLLFILKQKPHTFPRVLSLDVIQFLCQEYAEAALLQDNNGMTPLHHVCGYKGYVGYGGYTSFAEHVSEYVLDAMKIIYDTCPKAARTQNSAGFTPFHLACRGNNVPAVTILLERDPVLLFLLNGKRKQNHKQNRKKQDKSPWDNDISWDEFYKDKKIFFDEMKKEICENSRVHVCVQDAALALVGELVHNHEKLPSQMQYVVAEHFAKLLETRPFPSLQDLHSPDVEGKTLRISTKRGRFRVCTKLQIYNDLQAMLYQSAFQEVLKGYHNTIRINQSGYLREDPGNKAKSVAVLVSTAGGANKISNVHLLFQQLRANTLLCNRESSTSTSLLEKNDEQQQLPGQSKRKRKANQILANSKEQQEQQPRRSKHKRTADHISANSNKQQQQPRRSERKRKANLI